MFELMMMVSKFHVPFEKAFQQKVVDIIFFDKLNSNSEILSTIQKNIYLLGDNFNTHSKKCLNCLGEIGNITGKM